MIIIPLFKFFLTHTKQNKQYRRYISQFGLMNFDHSCTSYGDFIGLTMRISLCIKNRILRTLTLAPQPYIKQNNEIHFELYGFMLPTIKIKQTQKKFTIKYGKLFTRIEVEQNQVILSTKTHKQEYEESITEAVNYITEEILNFQLPRTTL